MLSNGRTIFTIAKILLKKRLVKCFLDAAKGLRSNPVKHKDVINSELGAQWFSGSVLDPRPRSGGFETHQRHWVVALEQDTFILAKYWFNPGRPVLV